MGVRSEIQHRQRQHPVAGSAARHRVQVSKEPSAFALVSTLTALIGFYVTLSLMFPTGRGSGKVAAGLAQSFHAGAIWIACGILSSPFAGAVGSLVKGWRSVVAIIGITLALEPFAMFAASRFTIPVVHLRWWFEWGWFAYAEIALGSLLTVSYFRQDRWRRIADIFSSANTVTARLRNMAMSSKKRPGNEE